MDEQRHIIKKQIIELNLSSQQGAFELQNEVSRIYRSKVIPLIDDLLTKFSNSDIIHKINTLEINLGNIDINNLEQELIDKIVEQIQPALSEKISLSSSNFSTQSNPNVKLNESSPSDQIETSNIASKTASQLDIFSYFIQTGMLPWWSEKLNKQELEEYGDRLITTSPEQLKSILAESFQEEKYSRRIIYQLSDSILLKFTKLISPKFFNFIANYYSDIQQIYKKKIDILTNIPPKEFRLELWRGIFLIILFEGFVQSKKVQFARNNLLHIATTFGFNYLSLIDKMLEITENFKKEDGVFKSQLPEILAQINPRVTRGENSIAIESEQSINQREVHSSIAIKALVNTVAPFSDSEEIYIYNSGLVLLWPFLPRFFKTLKLIQQGNFINSESAQQAILILQYLVDETTEIPEYVLPLNKILCGMDLLEPITANLEITEQQRDECEHLLSMVISNWSILKNTSIKGFRRAFLQRKGILKVRDRSWMLQVEEETYDILFDRLPWSISVVKLPWMKEMLFVEWCSSRPFD